MKKLKKINKILEKKKTFFLVREFVLKTKI